MNCVDVTATGRTMARFGAGLCQDRFGIVPSLHSLFEHGVHVFARDTVCNFGCIGAACFYLDDWLPDKVAEHARVAGNTGDAADVH